MGPKLERPPSDIEQVIQVLRKHPRNCPLPDSAWWEEFRRYLLRIFGGFKKTADDKPLPQLARQLQFQDDIPSHVQEVAAFRTAKEIVAVKYEGITCCKKLAQLAPADGWRTAAHGLATSLTA